MIRIARDLCLLHPSRNLPHSPTEFDGPLDELFERHILPALPAPEHVATFHRTIVDYVGDSDPLFLIRSLRGTERGSVFSVADGSKFRATDNAPAWWTQAATYRGAEVAPGSARDVFASLPTHLFETSKSIGQTAAACGWHIAHIFDVKDGDTKWERWDRRELTKRFIRNIHPCNYFLIPHTDWRRWGGDDGVLSFFVYMYRLRYADVWPEFLRLAQAPDDVRPATQHSLRITFGSAAVAASLRPGSPHSPVTQKGTGAGDVEAAVTYRASRLRFLADVIEALGPNDAFHIVTPVGTFQMSKAEFYRAFPRIPLTASYREARVYSFPKVPKAALPFLISTRDAESGAQ